MATVKNSKKDSVPNKMLYSRMSYIHQAAMYLVTKQQISTEGEQTGGLEDNGPSKLNTNALEPLARRLISDLRHVSQKGTIRMSPEMKCSTCKYCDTVLIDGSTCSTKIENKSKCGKKPWADILVRKCNTCGFAKRFPVAAERQQRRPHRTPKTVATAQESHAD
jgi:ribonuclease P protein subunit RPR2